ncbi:MAG: MFS transporter [candidate division Zixibacteria bacterium]|nr:MFS transporter [candidate division Zixibacteria bacterium]
MISPTRLFNKDFVLLWQGQLVSQVGSMVYSVALMFWLKGATGSATLVGLVMMASAIPGVLLGPLAGAYADRHSRRNIIVVTDLVRGLVICALAGYVFWRPDDTSVIITLLFVAAAVNAGLGAFFNPAVGAAIPDIVPAGRVASANSLNQLSMQVAQFVGQGTGGVLFRVVGAPALFLLNGLSYILSAISEMFMTIPQEIPERQKGRAAVVQSFVTDLREGFAYVWRTVGLRRLFMAAAFLNFFFVPVGILMPFFVEDHLRSTPDWYGFIMAGMGVGAMVGYLAAGAFSMSGRLRSVLMITALSGLSVMLFVIAPMNDPFPVMAALFVSGLCAGFFNIGVMTILQLSTPSRIRGRVFGLLGTLAMGLSPIAMGLAGVVADMVDQNIPLLFASIGAITMCLTIAMATSRAFREYLAFEPPASNEPTVSDQVQQVSD